MDFLGPANALNAVTARPTDPRTWASLDTWFKNCTDPDADDGTAYTAEFFNGVIAAMREVWRMNGGLVAAPATKVVAEDGTSDSGLQLAIRHMIQRGQANFAPDTGAAGAAILTASPVPPEFKFGMTITTILAGANPTTTPVANLNGLGNKRMVRFDGSDPLKGEFAGAVSLFYDGAAWRVTSNAFTPNQSSMYVNATPGAFNWVAPVWCNRIWGEGIGGGGGGGSCPSTPGTARYGGAGGGGGLVRGFFDVTPGATYTGVVGAGGAGQTSTSGGNGAAGGTTYLNGLFGCSGGGGGLGQGSGTLAGGFSGFGYSGQYNSGLGDGSTGGILDTSNFNLSAPGCGGGPGGQSGAGSGSPGWPGRGYGGGGGGSSRCENGSQGGNGFSGCITIIPLRS